MSEIKINWYPPRSCWRKSITVDGKEVVKYYAFPQNKAGRELAVAQYLRDKANLTGMSFEDKIAKYLPAVIEFHSMNPHEGMIVHHLRGMLKTLELPDREKWATKDIGNGNYDYQYPLDQLAINWGKQSWQLPDLYYHFLSNKKTSKADGSIGYYLNLYIQTQSKRTDLKASSITARVRQIIPYEQFIDHTLKITGINNQSIRDFENHLNNMDVSKSTKKSYFSAFVQFLVFLEIETDFVRPKQLTMARQKFKSTESTAESRLKKQQLLWTPELFNDIRKSLPDEKALWVLLALNCGFRNTDISHLKWENIKGDRLLHQRHKLSDFETAPTINYKLWPETLELLKKQKTKGELVFLNSNQEPYHKEIKIKGVKAAYDGIANWWQKNRINYDLPRLDYLRKTGASFVASKSIALSRVYLAETLQSVEAIHYIFNDGKVNEELDTITDLMRENFIQ